MNGFLFTVAYLVIAFVVWLKVYAMLYRQHRRDFKILEWGNGERLFGIFWGGFVSLLWPMTIPCFLVYLAGAWVGKVRLSWFEHYEERIKVK